MFRRFRAFQSGLLAVLLAAFGLAACQPKMQFRGEEVANPEPAPELEGVNWNGEPFALEALQGKVVVVFFGYTFCPDICPFTLAKMQQVEQRLGAAAEDLEVVFVSVDPHRDTEEKLASYVPNFNQDFYGIRLEPHELDEASEPWGLTVQYGQPQDGPGTPSFYYVDHTGTFFILDRQGRLRLTFPPDASVDDLVPDLQLLLEG